MLSLKSSEQSQSHIVLDSALAEYRWKLNEFGVTVVQKIAGYLTSLLQTDGTHFIGTKFFGSCFPPPHIVRCNVNRIKDHKRQLSGTEYTSQSMVHLACHKSRN